MGWSHYAHAGQLNPKASISWTIGSGEASAMWASPAVQRHSEGQREAV